MFRNQTVLIFSYFCFIPDPTTTPPPKSKLITTHNIYRSLYCSEIVLRWTHETLSHFSTFQTRNDALNHLENLMFSLYIYIYIYIYTHMSRNVFVCLSLVQKFLPNRLYLSLDSDGKKLLLCRMLQNSRPFNL